LIRNIIIVVLLLAVVGTSYWGYQERKAKNAVLVQAENNYQRAFHDLSYQVDVLHDNLGNTLAMNSRKSLSPALTDVWRISSEARTDVGQLPLTLMPFNKTEEFLSDIGNFSYRTAVRDLEKEPLTDKEYARLQKLYTQAGDVQNDLRKVQYQVIKNDLRWMDVEKALALDDENADNTIVDGFRTVEKRVSGYSETPNNDPTFISSRQQDDNFKNVKGKKISRKEAIEKAKDYADLKHPVNVKVHSNAKGADYGFYSISMSDKSGNDVNMDLTKKGGYPIWYMNTRKVKAAKMSLNEASNKAIAYLKQHKFDSLDLYESAQYDNTGLFNFVTTVNGVRVYPDAVKVQVALDNGDVIGFSADEFLKAHKLRNIGNAKLTSKQARTKISPKVKIMEDRKAIIENDVGEEVLCYEFLGTINQDTYRIYINANTGQEEKVEKLKDSEPVYENMI
jgi:spore germination protein